MLRVKLLPGELDTISTRSTSSVEAYEYYLMGRSFYLRGIDKRSLTIARSMYAKAAEIGPCYARADAGIAPLRDSPRYQVLAQRYAPENAASVAAAR